MGELASGATGRKRIIWLHTQPEHYFNCMMDDLARGEGYGGVKVTAGGGGGGGPEPWEWVAAFSYRGPGWYKENAQPKLAQTLFLTPRHAPGTPGADQPPTFLGNYHKDWRGELFAKPVDAMIVSGYGWRTHREVMLECRRRGIPVAMWSDSNLRSQRGRGRKARLKRGLKKAFLSRYIDAVDFELTTNRLGIAYWRYYKAPAKKIVLCPYYSDYTRIDAARVRSRAEVLARIGLAEGDRLLFSAARLVPAKGLDLMIRAFARSGLAATGWKYVIAGVGELEGKLKQMAGAELGKSTFFIGFQQPSENLALMAQAEMLVLPSRYEPHGIVVAEALAAGTPVLTSDVVGASADLLIKGISGISFHSEDEEDLLKKLRWAREHEREIRGMRAGARQVFDHWYAKTSPIRVVPEVVARMLARQPSRGGNK